MRELRYQLETAPFKISYIVLASKQHFSSPKRSPLGYNQDQDQLLLTIPGEELYGYGLPLSLLSQAEHIQEQSNPCSPAQGTWR